MRKITIFTAFILAVVMLVSCSDGDVGTESTTENSDNTTVQEAEFMFEERSDGTLSLEKYNGNASEVTVPDEWEGVAVTAVSAFAFEGHEELVKAVLPEGVTEIEACAFAGCSALAEIVFSESATYISKESFEDTPWYNALPEGFVVINGTVLEYKGFDDTVTSLEIPDGVCRIGDKAFTGLGIKSVKIPDSVTSIGERAFNKCTSLMKIALSGGISEIGYAAFHDTAWFNMQSGVVVVGDILVGCKGTGATVAIPDKVKTIAGGAFLGCNAIVLSIPEGVERICDYAFTGCTQLMKINLPSTVKEIGVHAFEICPTLEAINVSADNPLFSSKDGSLFDKSGTSELFCPEGKAAEQSETDAEKES